MITVFYAKANSINPSYSVLYDEMSVRRAPDLRVVNVSTLSLDEIERLANESDLVVVDSFIRAASELNPSGLSSVMLENWRGEDFYKITWEVVSKADAPILYVASGWDLHWTGHQLEELLPRLAGIAWLYERKPTALAEVPVKYRDVWMATQADPMSNWEAVRSKIGVRIELIHSVAAHEFVGKSHSPRWDVCIAGDTYRPRVLADESARNEGLKVAPIRKADAALLFGTGKLPFVAGNTLASLVRNRMRLFSQRSFTQRSAVNFVCGSGYKYPVRKFFEIPAVRSALLSYPCTGMRDYGFIDGEHFLEIAPEDFGREARRLRADEDKRTALALKAWEMVRRLHSTSQRVDDLIECMRRMAVGRLRSAQFQEGQFVIE